MIEIKIPTLQLIKSEINEAIDNATNQDYINGLLKALGIVAKYDAGEKDD